MRILFIPPPAKTSRELDLLRAVPGADVVVAGNPAHHEVDLPLSSVKVPILGSPERWTAALAWLRGLHALDPGPVDLVVSMELFSATSAQAAELARRLRAPHLVAVFEILDDNPLYRLPPWRSWTHRVAAHASAVLTFNGSGRRHALSKGVDARRLHTVAPGVDTSLFSPPPLRPRDPVAVCVGELRADKGVLDVVAAADLVAGAVGPRFRLVVIGDGPLRSRLDAAARSRPWLHLRGRLPRAEVAAALRAARAFVLAPHRRRFWAEQFGFASVEAMATALPIVITRCGAIPDVVPPHNAIVDERDVEGLAAGLRRALSDEGAGWGARNRAHVCSHHDVERQGRRLRDVLDEVCERYREPR